MFSPEIRVSGFSATEWKRLAEAFRPAEGQQPSSVGARGAVGGVVAVTQGRALRKLVHTRLGRLDAGAQPWPVPLSELAEGQSARWAAEVNLGALDDLMERFAQRLRPEHDWLDQVLILLGEAKALELRGGLTLWPRQLGQIPTISRVAADRALDALCPNAQTLLFGVFHRGEVWTALAARRSVGGFDRLIGPSKLRPGMGLLSGDWSRDYRHLIRATESEVGPVGVGCFGELATFQELAGSGRPGSWAQAVATRDIILSPVVPALAIPLGLDFGRAALAKVRDLAGWVGQRRSRSGFSLGGWSPPSWSAGAVSGLLERAEALSSEYDIKGLLGFDPLDFLYKLVARDKRRE